VFFRYFDAETNRNSLRGAAPIQALLHPEAIAARLGANRVCLKSTIAFLNIAAVYAEGAAIVAPPYAVDEQSDGPENPEVVRFVTGGTLWVDGGVFIQPR
jgi:hypothetical protein